MCFQASSGVQVCSLQLLPKPVSIEKKYHIPTLLHTISVI